MADFKSDRRKFLKYLGLTTSATLATNITFASFIDTSEIIKLNSEQQEFMIRYGKWMDDFTEIIKKLKATPENIEHKQMMMTITNQVKELQPELNNFMKDKTFALIYRASIKRVTAEI